MIKIVSRLVKKFRDNNHARQRQIDIEILWPQIKKNAPSLERAKYAFMLHTSTDSAWTPLSLDQVMSIVDKLE